MHSENCLQKQILKLVTKYEIEVEDSQQKQMYFQTSLTKQETKEKYFKRTFKALFIYWFLIQVSYQNDLHVLTKHK